MAPIRAIDQPSTSLPGEADRPTVARDITLGNDWLYECPLHQDEIAIGGNNMTFEIHLQADKRKAAEAALGKAVQ
ncbi:hypothetical protein HNQ59_002803 [Chitinivorax tropicus]|uniref:Uncharacterized protein n=1 Tax=Chitinivorax tropicus TaxID=714531 RepID=A0A840MWF5_9PROT|nr:hypothetical protein [Chitinivorax tropicus]